MNPEDGTVAKRYETLVYEREPFLTRARDCSALTIPSLCPPEGHTGSSKLPVPYQSLGARGVNNLASKLLLTLLPPSTPFFRLTPTAQVEEKVTDEEKQALEEALSDVEQRVLRNLESRGFRTHAFEAFKHLIVSGNVLLHLPKKGARVFPLQQFVCKRDAEGNVLEIIVKESVSPSALPEEVRKVVEEKITKENQEHSAGSEQRSVDIFTKVCLEDSGWVVYQECKGVRIPGSEGHYPKDRLPWFPLRWTRIDGESYGRGLCEEYFGALKAYDALSHNVLDYAAVASMLKFGRDGSKAPLASPAKIAATPNGGFFEGPEGSIWVLQAQKYADMQVVKATCDEIKRDLEYAFLLNSAIQRQGERVTAEEIRYMASEIEDALGGVYSILAEEFQRPLVIITMNRMQESKELPSLPKNAVNPTILTGVDALGRNHELMRLQAALGWAGQVLGPEVVSRHLKPGAILTFSFAAMGLKQKGFVRPEEEVAAEMQQQQMMALGEKAVGPGINAMSQQAIAAQAAEKGT